jgi:hypothetical protein
MEASLLIRSEAPQRSVCRDIEQFVELIEDAGMEIKTTVAEAKRVDLTVIGLHSKRAI